VAGVAAMPPRSPGTLARGFVAALAGVWLLATLVRLPALAAPGSLISSDSAVAGIIVAPIVLVQYDTGIPLGIKGFVACIIGGLGKPTGAAVGGLLLGVLEAFATGLLSSGYKNAIAFVLLLVFLFVRPGGLFGELERVES